SSLEPGYVKDFARWAYPILERSPQAIAVIPDVIGGTEAQNRELVQDWSQHGVDEHRSMPIWHLNESLDYLKYLAERFNHIGFGSAGEFWQPGTPEWHRRIDQAFAALKELEDQSGTTAYVRPRIHMMRAQALAHLYPFDSSDSTNVAQNHGRYREQG